MVSLFCILAYIFYVIKSHLQSIQFVHHRASSFILDAPGRDDLFNDLLAAGHFPHVLKSLNPLLIGQAIRGIPRRPFYFAGIHIQHLIGIAFEQLGLMGSQEIDIVRFQHQL